MRARYCIIASLCVFACSVQAYQSPEDVLADDLLRMATQTQQNDAQHVKMKAEAADIARILVRETFVRNQVYQMRGSALFHNFLIKRGKKVGGYCYHWTRDLISALTDMPYQYFTVSWGTANLGKRTENNAVLIAPRGAKSEAAIVYDAWRGRGKPYWRLAARDHYQWKVRFTEKNLLMGLAEVIE